MPPRLTLTSLVPGRARQLHTSHVIKLPDTSPNPPVYTPTSLGLKEHKGRERALPTIDIPVNSSSRLNLQDIGNRPAHRSPKRYVAASKPMGTNTSRRTDPEKPPRDRQKPPQTPTTSIPPNEEFTDFFEDSELVEPILSSPNSRKGKMSKVNLDLDSFSIEEANTVAARFTPRKNKNTSSSNTGRRPELTTAKPVRSDDRKGRSRRDGDSNALDSGVPARQTSKVEVVIDQSSKGLFGVQSLLNPVVRGARDAEGSFWANGMETDKARKTDLLRLAGSYDLYKPDLPTTPLSSKPSLQEIKQWAEYVLSLNSSVGMRKTVLGKEVLAGYLKA